MEQTRRALVGAVISALGLTSEPAGAEARELPAFVVYLSDQAPTEPRVLEQARSQADRIFNDAGVRVLWRDVKESVYNPGCDGFSVLVTLLSPAMVRQLSLQGMSERALGSAARAAGRAFIHPGRIHDFASNTRSDAGHLMGRVMAHEIGHLLLPAGHSHYGIMSAGMDTDPSVAARFTVQQARAIRGLVETETATFVRRADCGR